MNKIIIIAGPTASGKTNLAVEIAKKLNTEIISCDSMQIYKHMDIGTAKVTKDEMQGIKHHMIDILEPNESFSVAEYSQKAKEIIDNINKEHKIPIICGGTGLYIDSLLYPLSMGVSDNSVRERLTKEYEEFGIEHMYKKLQELDYEESLKIHQNNIVRVIRALEIIELTGKPKSMQQDRTKDLNYDTLLICLDLPRETLYERINKRVDIMFNNGLEKEIQDLLDNNITFEMQSMQAIGYKEFKDVIVNNLTREQLIDIIKKESRHYAKRQITWFKRYAFTNFVNPNNKEKINNLITEFCEVKNVNK